MVNKTNHPSRKGVPIKPSKGGRTKRYTFSMTPEDWTELNRQTQVANVSLNDWLHNAIHHAKSQQADPSPP